MTQKGQGANWLCQASSEAALLPAAVLQALYKACIVTSCGTLSFLYWINSYQEACPTLYHSIPLYTTLVMSCAAGGAVLHHPVAA
jgi:hypothetical protein